MRKLAIALAALFIVGCATGPKLPTYKRDYEPVDVKEFKYEDKNIVFTYTPVTFGSSIPFVMTNKTEKPIKVIWDETTFINPSGQSEKVIHEGVRLLDRNAPMVPSVIPPRASLTDSISPTSRVIWSGTSWEHLMICGEQKLIPFTGYEQRDEECVGKTFGIFVTYEVLGNKTQFTVKYLLKSRSKNSVE